MVASLPPNIQLKLDQTLQQWRQWRCEPPLWDRPGIVSLFGSGMSNYSVLVEAGQHYVIRIDGVHAAANGLSRATEWRCLINAHKTGLAPGPRYFNPELGTLVCDFLPEDESHGTTLTETAHLLRDIHSLPAIHHRLDLRDRINSYERQLAHCKRTLPDIMVHCRDEIFAMAIEIDRHDSPQVLCHNDLLAANRIYSKGLLRAIDWEYCAMGSPWFDLAVVIVGDGLSETQKLQLIEAYLQRTITAREESELARATLVYQYLELLWYLFNDSENQDLDNRLAALQSRIKP